MGVKRVIPGTPGGSGLHLINAGSMAGTATITSPTFNANNLDNVGLEVSWTGTPTGTISVLASISNENFYALTFDPTLTQPAGSPGAYLINLNQVPFPYVQVQYVNSSGSGTLDVWLSGKDLN
jgi:hypothetical protein